MFHFFQNCQSDVDYSQSGSIQQSVDSQLVDLTGEEFDVLRGKYIRRLTGVLVHHIPAFWKIAHSVFSGKFAKVFVSIFFVLLLSVRDLSFIVGVNT